MNSSATEADLVTHHYDDHITAGDRGQHQKEARKLYIAPL
jgi:hypothetical protein